MAKRTLHLPIASVNDRLPAATVVGEPRRGNSLPPRKAKDRTEPAPWYCVCCQTLLGVVRGQWLHIKYKAANYMVKGRVVAVCRKCGTLNTYITGVGAVSCGRWPPEDCPTE